MKTMKLTKAQEGLYAKVLADCRSRGSAGISTGHIRSTAKSWGALVGAGLLRVLESGIDSWQAPRGYKTYWSAWASYLVVELEAK